MPPSVSLFIKCRWVFFLAIFFIASMSRAQIKPDGLWLGVIDQSLTTLIEFDGQKMQRWMVDEDGVSAHWETAPFIWEWQSEPANTILINLDRDPPRTVAAGRFNSQDHFEILPEAPSKASVPGLDESQSSNFYRLGPNEFATDKEALKTLMVDQTFRISATEDYPNIAFNKGGKGTYRFEDNGQTQSQEFVWQFLSKGSLNFLYISPGLEIGVVTLIEKQSENKLYLSAFQNGKKMMVLTKK